MGLREELTEVPPTRCAVGKLLETLPDDVRAELEELLTDYSITSSSLGRLAIKKGWDCREQSFSRHRRGVCLCH